MNKDMSLLEEKAAQLDVPNAYFEFFRRNQKLLFMSSRDSLTKIMSYLNYFRVMQKNTNLMFMDLATGEPLEGHTFQNITVAQYQQ